MTQEPWEAFFAKCGNNRIGLIDKSGFDYGGCYCTVEELFQMFKFRMEAERIDDDKRSCSGCQGITHTHTCQTGQPNISDTTKEPKT